MLSGVQCRADFFSHQHSAHREPAGEWLRECDNVGSDTDSFIGEQIPCTTEPALNLIEDESDIFLARQLSQPAQESRIEYSDTAFSLHRLDDNRRHCLL